MPTTKYPMAVKMIAVAMIKKRFMALSAFLSPRHVRRKRSGVHAPFGQSDSLCLYVSDTICTERGSDLEAVGNQVEVKSYRITHPRRLKN